MKKNKGKLSMNNKYLFVNITDLGEQSGVCYNCGSPIRYSVHLVDTNNEHYYVGTECSKTLAEASISNSYSMQETIKEHMKVAKAIRIIEQNKCVKLYSGKDRIIVVGMLGKTPHKITIEKLFNPFTEEPMQFTHDFVDKYSDNNRDWCMAYVFDYFDELKKICKA